MGISVYPEPTQTVTLGDSPQTDAFGRVRVSQPVTLFDSKQLHDKQPLFWDESTSGTGVAGSHSTATASTTLSVTAGTGSCIRSTFRRFNYQPGKSQLILVTGVLAASGGGAASGVTRRMGWFDANNGVFLEDAQGTYKVVIRNATSDTAVAQSSWSLDTMDGNGPSGITVDFSKAQIVVIDAEWLGVGRVRIGLNIGGVTYYVHQFNHANSVTDVYMATPNLPIRYEISTTSGAGSLKHICSTVISEGGVQDNGIIRTISTAGDPVDMDTEDSLYVIVGLRLRSTHLDASIKMLNANVQLQSASDNIEWQVIFNPTVSAGTPSWQTGLTNSALEYYLGSTAASGQVVVTGGTVIQHGYVSTGTGPSGSSNAGAPLENALTLGSSIAGTSDVIVLAARPIDGSATNVYAEGGLTWRELS